MATSLTFLHAEIQSHPQLALRQAYFHIGMVLFRMGIRKIIERINANAVAA